MDLWHFALRLILTVRHLCELNLQAKSASWNGTLQTEPHFSPFCPTINQKDSLNAEIRPLKGPGRITIHYLIVEFDGGDGTWHVVSGGRNAAMMCQSPTWYFLMRCIDEAESFSVISLSNLATASHFAFTSRWQGKHRHSTQGDLQSPHRIHQWNPW